WRRCSPGREERRAKPAEMRRGARVRSNWRMPALGEAPRLRGGTSRLYYTSGDLQSPIGMMTTPDAAVEATKKSEREPVNAHYDTRLPDLPWSRRVQIPIIAAAVFAVIRTLGPTLRYEVLGWQHAERVYATKKQCI